MGDPGVLSQTISDIDAFIAEKLQPELPYCLPLLRRIQFHQKHPTPNAEIRVFYSGGTFLAAHIDLTIVGQTQVWLYASWEPLYAGKDNSPESVYASAHVALYRAFFAALFAHIQTHHIPYVSKEPGDQWLRLKNEGKIVSLPYSRTKVLFGTIAECLWPFLDEYKSGKQVSRDDRRWLKYIISDPPTSLPIPKGLVLDKMQDQHLQGIIDRTTIPRTLEMVKQLENVGLFEDGRPVAWGLLSKDGSLASLHTEPEWRGKGLAMVVGQELMRMQKEMYGGSPCYHHVDVGEKNLASRRVVEKLGGKVMWLSAWIELDLGEA